MPRNGDGSSDNGPFPEAEQNLTHGSTGDDTIKHTSNNVAPPPEGEKGKALPGLNASGGGVAPPNQPNPKPEDK